MGILCAGSFTFVSLGGFGWWTSQTCFGALFWLLLSLPNTHLTGIMTVTVGEYEDVDVDALIASRQQKKKKIGWQRADMKNRLMIIEIITISQ